MSDHYHCNTHTVDFEMGKWGWNAIGNCFLVGNLFTTLCIEFTSTVSPISAIMMGL